MEVKTTVPTGVVLDYVSSKALLYMAAKEGLVDDDPILGRGLVEYLLKEPPTLDRVRFALEQLVAGGRVFIPNSFPSLEGQAFTDGTIRALPLLEPDRLIRLQGISVEFLLGLAASHGVNWTEDELCQRADRWGEAVAGWRAAGGGDDLAQYLLPQMAPKGVRRRRALTRVMAAALKELEDAKLQLESMTSALNEYLIVLTHSVNEGALSSIPLRPATRATIPGTVLDDSSERVELVKITCKHLPRPPVRATLRETMKVCMSPAGQAYRTKLSEWTARLRSGEHDSLEPVIREIERAAKEMGLGRKFSSLGTFATIIGVVPAVAGLFDPNLNLLTSIGGMTTFVGGAALVGKATLQRWNRWAAFS